MTMLLCLQQTYSDNVRVFRNCHSRAYLQHVHRRNRFTVCLSGANARCLANDDPHAPSPDMRAIKNPP